MNTRITLFRTAALIVLLFLFPGMKQLHAQTVLAAGDIAFTGYNCNNATTNTSEFTFVILKAGGVANTTQIVFTDNGWNSVTSSLYANEGNVTWSATSAVAQFTEITVKVNTSGTTINSVSNGSAAFSGTSFSLASSGDQILAYQGTSASPTFIAGIHMNANVANGTSAASSLSGWDDLQASGGWSINANNSALPTGLTNGVSAVMVVTGAAAPYTEWDNALYNCTGATGASSLSALAASINDRANWSTVNSTPYTLPPTTPCTFSIGSPAAITGNPSNASTCVNNAATFTATASDVSSWAWEESTNGGTSYNAVTVGGVYGISSSTGVSGSSTLTITNPPSTMNTYKYRAIATGSVGGPATSTAATLTVTTTNTWTGGTSTAWNTATNWGCGAIPIATSDVIIPSGTSFSPTVNISSAICNAMTINSGASLSFTAGSNVLEVKGNFTNNGTFTATAGKLKLSGTAAQTVPAATYKDFELAGTGTKTAQGAITITGVLTLTTGFLQMGVNDLTLGNSASITGSGTPPAQNGQLQNTTPTSYIITNSTGQLKIQNIGVGGKTGAVVFPIGTSTSSYTPLSIQNAGTVDIFGARVINNVYKSYTVAGIPNGPQQNTYNVGKTWHITETTAGGSNATVNFAWASTDEQPGFNDGACFASHYINGGWNTVLPAQTASGSDPYSLALNNVTSFSPFAVGSQFSILPLDLLSFTGKTSKAGTVLNWVTANEKNVAGFDVERATDGRNYQRIGYVAARANNSTTETDYSYTDVATPAGTAYYRLKMADFDATFKYSNTVVINTDGSNAGTFTVFPNPVDGNNLNIQLSNMPASDVAVQITDATGRVWYNGSIEAGKAILPVNIKTMPAGIYQVHVGGDINATTRFTKL